MLTPTLTDSTMCLCTPNICLGKISEDKKAEKNKQNFNKRYVNEIFVQELTTKLSELQNKDIREKDYITNNQKKHDKKKCSNKTECFYLFKKIKTRLRKKKKYISEDKKEKEKFEEHIYDTPYQTIETSYNPMNISKNKFLNKEPSKEENFYYVLEKDEGDVYTRNNVSNENKKEATDDKQKDDSCNSIYVNTEAIIHNKPKRIYIL